MKKNKREEKKTIKDTILIIYKNLKEIFSSKDKEHIGTAIGKIIYILFIAIIVKIPFIFLKTIVLDSLNNNKISYLIQDLISGGIEVVYIFIAICVMYNYLGKYFGDKSV